MKTRSSEPFASTLRIEPEPSRLLRRVLVLVYCLSGLFLVVFSAGWLVTAASLSLLGLAAFTGYRGRVAGDRVFRSAVWHADGAWQVVTPAGARRQARLLPSTFIHSLVVVLHFQLEDGGKGYLVLCRDSLAPDLFRRLRARMRVAGLDSGSGG